jgi:hypothetical protein
MATKLSAPPADFYGWRADYGESYRATLPPTERFPVVDRKDGVSLPPYILIRNAQGREPDGRYAFLFEGSGLRAASGGQGWHPGVRYLNVGDPEVPAEWLEPIEAALAEARTRWGDCEICCDYQS